MDNCEGKIELDHFSGFGVGWLKKKLRKKFYAVRTYYLSQAINIWLTHIVVVLNVKTHLKVCAKFVSYHDVYANDDFHITRFTGC